MHKSAANIKSIFYSIILFFFLVHSSKSILYATIYSVIFMYIHYIYFYPLIYI